MLSDIALETPLILTTGRGKGDSGQPTFFGYNSPLNPSQTEHILVHCPLSPLLYSLYNNDIDRFLTVQSGAATALDSVQIPHCNYDDDGVLHRSRGDSKLPTTRLKRDGKLINKREAREAGSARPEAITENRGDNQGNEKKGKTCTRRSSTYGKERRKESLRRNKRGLGGQG